MTAATSATSGSEPLLSLHAMSVRFGGVYALRNVDLSVEAGTLHGLIGPNGAGKTTLIDAVTGFERCSGGDVRYHGRAVNHWTPHRRAQAGLVRTFQNLELFPELTVRDNLKIPVPTSRREAPDLLDIAGRVGVRELLDRQVRELPHGVQRLVSIGRALATLPTLLILDEPAAGLDTHETLQLGRTLRSIVESSVTVLLVDHDMHLVMDICDVITVLAGGANLAHGRPGEISRDLEVRRVYLGEADDESA